MRHKILLAEDEPFLAKVIMESLEKKGYDVVLAPDGKVAWGLFNETEFSLCILDVMMPNKDGFTLASQIREANHKIPIMFLTAKAEIKNVAQGYANGGNDYLRKPFSLEELFFRVAELLRRNGVIENVISEDNKIGTYIFIAKRQELIDAQMNNVKLSYKESRLLEMLLENKNNVLDRKAALLKLWGDNNFFTTRNMDVYITKLRKKLQQDATIEIVNIRGYGYKLIC